MSKIILLFFVLSLVSTSFAKTYSKCELVQAMRRYGLPEHLLKDFVCLADAESSLQTHVRGGPNSDGSYDYGIFQINDRYWCNAGDHPGKGCNVRCNDLLSDDISASVACAKVVLAQQGIDAWFGWVNKCKGRWQPDLHC